MKSLSDYFEPGQRRGQEAFVRLQKAYETVFFTGLPEPEDRDIVLADLATFCGSFFVEPADMSHDELRESNGRKLVLARIIRLGLGRHGDLSELYRAVVKETQTNQKEHSL